MHRHEFHLNIPPGRLLQYYRGESRSVIARAADGRNIQFPANLLVRHVAADGVVGRFVLTTDANHKVIDLERLDAGT